MLVHLIINYSVCRFLIIMERHEMGSVKHASKEKNQM